MTLQKGLKNIKVPGADNVVNELFKYSGCEVRDKLLKIRL